MKPSVPLPPDDGDSDDEILQLNTDDVTDAPMADSGSAEGSADEADESSDEANALSDEDEVGAPTTPPDSDDSSEEDAAAKDDPDDSDFEQFAQEVEELQAELEETKNELRSTRDLLKSALNENKRWRMLYEKSKH